MKTANRIGMFLLLLALPGIAAGQYYDDLYIRPSDKKHKEKKVEKVETVQRQPAAEVIVETTPADDNVIDSDWNVDAYNRRYATTDTSLVALPAAGTDTISGDGYYLNGFNGSQSDLEYAERIRRFHNPRFTIHITDPAYTDIYLLDSYDWNVYIDRNFAFVTPTWTNPYYWDYMWAPYSWSWSWRWDPFYWGFGYTPYGYWGNPYWAWNYPPYHGGWYAPPAPPRPDYRPQPSRPSHNPGGWSSRRPASVQPNRGTSGNRTITNQQGQRVRTGNTSRSAQRQNYQSAPRQNNYNSNNNRQSYTPSYNTGTRSGSMSNGGSGGGSRSGGFSSGSAGGGGGSRSRR